MNAIWKLILGLLFWNIISEDGSEEMVRDLEDQDFDVFEDECFFDEMDFGS